MAAEEAPNVDLITLTRHVLSEQYRLGASATGDLTLLLTAIQVTSKFIATNVRKARLINLVGLAGETNVQGEEQKKLDVLSNDIMVNALRASGKTAVLVSEELDDAIIIEERNRGAYCVVFDPLDGSSNIDAGVNIGTIFGIYKVVGKWRPLYVDLIDPCSVSNPVPREPWKMSFDLEARWSQLGTRCEGVNGYTLDAALGEFILTHPNVRLIPSYHRIWRLTSPKIQIPPRGKIYSFNEGNSMYFHAPVNAYLKSIKYPAPPKTPYSARYIGSMVADVHRTLLYGGIFGYPNDKKSKSGKLRLLYEAFPMAFLTEQAGGIATTGTGRILDIVPKSIHERCPVFLGSRDDVQDLINLKLSARTADQDSMPQSEPRRRPTKRLVVEDEDEDDQDHTQAHPTTLSSPPATSTHRGRSNSHTLEENSDFEAEYGSPEPELSPLSQPSSSSRLKRPKGKKAHDGPPPKKKRAQQDVDSDEEYHVGHASGDEELIVHTKRQSKPTAKAKANKGKSKSFSTGARDERISRQPQLNATEAKTSHVGGTKRRRGTSKVDDDAVDVVGEEDDRQSTRSPSPPPKESAPPPPKRRKFPTITKTRGAAAASEPASKTAGGKPTTPQLPDLPKPTLAGSRVQPTMVGSSDFDLRDARVYKDLFNKSGGSSSGTALQKKNEERQKEINKMREEARIKRASEMTKSFDLQTQFEKIQRCQETLGKNLSYPNWLAARWREVWDTGRRQAMEQARLEEGAWREPSQKEEGEVASHSER
ncbi:hypothetical protein C0991_003830 [Blastosporella zonata]|nr:hypothetical protein C0991_003830 [Blastosporella zonata]